MTKTHPQKILRVIVEGPDCSGKSLLVDRIKNVLKWDSKSLRHKEGNQYFRYLKEYSQEEIVLDRSHFSENVYAKLWRGGSPFSKQEKSILNEISTTNSLVIFALPTLRTMKKRYSSRNFSQQISFNDLAKSRLLFLKELRQTRALIYNSRDFDELEQILNKVKELI